MKSIGTKVLSATRRYQWLIITLLVLGGIFIYYFTIVLTQNEMRIKERGFRGLALMARNIEREINLTQEKNARNFLKDLEKYPGDMAKKKEIEKNYNLHKSSSESKINNLNDELEPSKIFITTVGSECRLNFEIKVGNVRDTLYAEAYSFIDPLLRADIFSRYLLMNDSFVIYKNLEGAFDPGLKDSLNGQMLKVNLEGQAYRMFNFPFTVQESTWWLAGMMPADQYRKEKMQLSSNVIISLIFIFFLCLLLFPFLKCFLMNKEEHLNSGDVVFAFFSFYLITATLTIASWNIYTYHALFRNGRDYQLQTLAEKIDTSLNKEINLAIGQLKIANELLDSMPFDYYNLNVNADTATRDANNKSVSSYFRNIITYPPVENIVWVDSSTGKQKFRWTTFKYIPEKFSVKDRPYFQKVIQNDLWKNDSGKTYYLDAIKSWLANDILAVISMKRDMFIKNGDTAAKKEKLKDTLHNAVTILSAKFKSVFDPVLPQGFGFAILDEQGKVYFHSNCEYNLHEDFIRETGNSSLLQSLLNTRMAEFFTAYYYGARNRFYIKPLKNMPLSVVVFCDRNKMAEHNISLLSASSVFIFIQAFLIFLSAILIQAFRAHNHTGIKKHALSWLPPKKIHEDAYLQHAWLYLLMILIEIFLVRPNNAWFTKGQPDGSLFTPGILFTYSILSIGFSYYLIRKSSEKDEESKQARRRSMIGIISLYLIVFFLFGLNLWKQNPGLLIYFVALQGLPFLIFKNIKWISTQANKLIRHKETKTSWKRTYVIAIMSFVILNGIVTVSKMYQLCYNQETTLMIKAQQLHLAKTIWRKKDDLFLKEDSSIGCYYKNIIAGQVNYDRPIDEFEVDKEDIRSMNFAWFYRKIRPGYKDFSVGLEAYTSAHSNDSVYQWQVEKRRIQLFAKSNNTAISDKHLNQLTIISPNSSLRLPGSNYLPGLDKTASSSLFKIVFYLGFLIILTGLTLLIWRYVKHVFHLHKPKEIPNNVPLLIKNLLDEKNGDLESRHLMIVGLPDCGKVKAVKKILENYKKNNGNSEKSAINTCKIDYRELTMMRPEKLMAEIEKIKTEMPKPDQSIGSSCKYYVLIRNFEYCFHDTTITQLKLAALEELLSQKHLNIILFSTTQTIPFIEDYFEQIKSELDNPNAEKTKEDPGDGKKAQAPGIAVESWISVMSKFSICYYKWNNQDSAEPLKDATVQPTTTEEVSKNDVINNIRKEINYMAPADNIDEDQILQQEKVDLMNSQVVSFYFDSIWMSLSAAEKRVLYDFAKDELVNHNNRDDLSVLHKKGLFTYVENENQFKLVSHSFQYYILNRLKRDEITKLEADQSDKGNWSKLRNMLVVIIILVGAFIFITQQEALNSLITYLSAFTGGLFTLLNVINKIPGSK